MAVVQTAVVEKHVAATAGMIANMLSCTVRSRRFTGATAGKFGHAVQEVVADEGEVEAGVSAANRFLGVLVIDRTLQPVQNDEFVQGDVASVLTEGEVYVPVEAAVTFGQDVTVDAATGQFSSAPAGAGQFAVMGARWMTSQATAGGLAVLRLDGSLPTR